MAERLEVQMNRKPCYSIVFSTDWNELVMELSEMELQDRKICIITDSNVDPIYGEDVTNAIKPCCKEVFRFVFPAGEENKNLDTVKDAYVFLIQNHFDRKDLLIALGGGVVGDLTGFVAATYLRGIDFIQVPTTLLAQADSSIGGKTGVDFDGYKNMVGAFKMPKLVFMNFETLKTLDERQYYSGFAE
nr:3-dehydroquinate synthase [Acetatifactor sp.]